MSHRYLHQKEESGKSGMMKCNVCLVLIIVGGFTGCSSEKTNKGLLAQLTEGPDQRKALEFVLKNPDTYSSDILFTAAAVAQKEKAVEHSIFLLYAAQLRVRYDISCFPPKGKGGDSPMVAYSALAATVGPAINNGILNNTEAFVRAIDRIRKWSPKAPTDYNPGYEFTQRLSENEANEAFKPHLTDFNKRMGDQAKLFADADYVQAARLVRTYNSTRGDKRPSQEEYDKAIATMKRIEKDKNLKGLFTT